MGREPNIVASWQGWQQKKAHLLLPIIYLRGFAGSSGGIEETAADPFNGFNVGSTLVRTGWTGETARHVFESPVLRLMQPPFNYRIAFSDGIRGLDSETKDALDQWRQFVADEPGQAVGSPPAGVIAIYRYYDVASQAFGDGARAGMEAYAWGLARLITDLLATTRASGVYLVAHSMGGLVARTLLQNPLVLDESHPDAGPAGRCAATAALLKTDPQFRLSQDQWEAARLSVRRFFTYGTPHNGISVQGGWLNGAAGLIGGLFGNEADNFDRDRMLVYLNRPPAPNSLGTHFDIEKVFCLIGTAAADYPVAAGFSSRLIGRLSDGLVELDNAVVCAPDAAAPGGSVLAARSYVRRAHSGPYGLVNSEEGFGNLSRFLFGDVRVEADLVVRQVDLPAELAERLAAPDSATKVRASYSFEVFLRVRGARWALTERLARDGAAVFRRYDELLPREPATAEVGLSDAARLTRERHQRLELFTAFLDTALRAPVDLDRVKNKAIGEALGFALRLRAAVPDYEVDGKFWRKNHYEGTALLDQDLVFLIYPDAAMPGGWNLAWGPNTADTSNSLVKLIRAADKVEAPPGAVTDKACWRLDGDRLEFWIPLREKGPPAFAAWLRLTTRHWNPKPPTA